MSVILPNKNNDHDKFSVILHTVLEGYKKCIGYKVDKILFIAWFYIYAKNKHFFFQYDFNFSD